MSQPHRIRTLRLDLRAAQPETAFRLRQAVATTVQSAQFARGLETLLDRLAPDGAECRIERLEVPVADLTPEAWERDGTARVLAALETALTRELRQGALKPDAALGRSGSFSESGEKSGSETWLDAFGLFLATGRLPWWAGAEALAEETVWAELLRQPSASVGARLAPALAQAEAARRLVWQFAPKTVFGLLERLSGIEPVERIRARETERVRWLRRQKLPAETLREAVETERAAWVQGLASRAWRAEAAWLEAEIQRMDEAAGFRPNAGPRTPPAGADQAGLDSRRANESFPVPTPVPRTKETSNGAANDASAPDFSEEKNVRAADESGISSKNHAPFFIANAGLVLLHPFVAPLLAELSFLENGRFRSEAHRHRALHLLAHLVGQKPFSTETSLLLPKILLGLPPEAPVQRRVRLSRTEKNEARALLEAVVEHWSALKNTSPEALQAEFFQREGRLEHRETGWHLTVEQRASDVLLGRLPWGISLVRLPWMAEWLHVTWS